MAATDWQIGRTCWLGLEPQVPHHSSIDRYPFTNDIKQAEPHAIQVLWRVAFGCRLWRILVFYTQFLAVIAPQPGQYLHNTSELVVLP